METETNEAEAEQVEETQASPFLDIADLSENSICDTSLLDFDLRI